MGTSPPATCSETLHNSQGSQTASFQAASMFQEPSYQTHPSLPQATSPPATCSATPLNSRGSPRSRVFSTTINSHPPSMFQEPSCLTRPFLRQATSPATTSLETLHNSRGSQTASFQAVSLSREILNQTRFSLVILQTSNQIARLFMSQRAWETAGIY